MLCEVGGFESLRLFVRGLAKLCNLKIRSGNQTLKLIQQQQVSRSPVEVSPIDKLYVRSHKWW